MRSTFSYDAKQNADNKHGKWSQSGRGQRELGGKDQCLTGKITPAIGHINGMNAQVASTAEEQSSITEEINRNVTSINAVADQNAAASNQITASSEELAHLACNLQAMISQFEV